MKFMKWIGVLAAATLIGSAFLPWVVIPSRNIIVTGLASEGTDFGKPAYFHFFATLLFLAFLFVARPWSARVNLVVTALNLAWAVRNFFVLAMCSGGECPEKQAGLYLSLAASVLMMASAMFPDLKTAGGPEKPLS